METKQTPLKCEICGAVFRDNDAYTKHKRIHEAEAEDNKELEQGTRQPTEAPTLPPTTPSVIGGV